MKKIIAVLGVIGIAIIAITLLLNLIFTAKINDAEQITISLNSVIYIAGCILLAVVIYFITYVINKKIYSDTDKNKLLRKCLFISSIIIYAIINILWVIFVRPAIVGDQIHVVNLAQTFFSGNDEEYLNNLTYAGIPLIEYMQVYSQQIPLAFVYSVIFTILHLGEFGVLRVLNVLGNIGIVIALYKIVSQLSKKYKVNKVLTLVLILTSVSLTMLTTFIYGDIPALALCLFAVYFVMRYVETKKIKHIVISTICLMLAYMMRMNSLIFVIGIVIYLLFNFISEFKEKENKEKIINAIIIIACIIVTLTPVSIVKNYYLDKYELDKNKAYPSISYILMAMSEGPRYNGWYNESIAENAMKNPIEAKEEYMQKIKERLEYFVSNPGYAIEFYTMKIASMWTENTYSAVINNGIEEGKEYLENSTETITIYQKSLLILMCTAVLIVLIQNRKNISLEVILLLIIFMGGFAFHILWEAKSRYIIPYIVVLIPLASILVDFEKLKIQEIYQKIKSKILKTKA